MFGPKFMLFIRSTVVWQIGAILRANKIIDGIQSRWVTYFRFLCVSVFLCCQFGVFFRLAFILLSFLVIFFLFFHISPFFHNIFPFSHFFNAFHPFLIFLFFSQSASYSLSSMRDLRVYLNFPLSEKKNSMKTSNWSKTSSKNRKTWKRQKQKHN